MQLSDDFVKFCSTRWRFGLTLPAPSCAPKRAAFGHAGAKWKVKVMSALPLCVFARYRKINPSVARVESSRACTPSKWRAPLGTGVEKEMKCKQIAKYIQKIVYIQRRQKLMKSSNWDSPPVLVLSGIHPISKTFVSTISHQFLIPIVCRTSGIARPRGIPS